MHLIFDKYCPIRLFCMNKGTSDDSLKEMFPLLHTEQQRESLLSNKESNPHAKDRVNITSFLGTLRGKIYHMLYYFPFIVKHNLHWGRLLLLISTMTHFSVIMCYPDSFFYEQWLAIKTCLLLPNIVYIISFLCFSILCIGNFPIQ